MKIKLSISVFLFCISLCATSQLTILGAYSAERIVKEVLLTNEIEVRNIRYVGNKQSIAVISDPFKLLDIDKGILLSTGKCSDFRGPNNREQVGTKMETNGDAEISEISRSFTYDAAILEFEFTATADFLSFQFIFGSEEYPEFVGSQFNDVFVFILTNLENGEKKNLAVIPNTETIITVNNVNKFKNSEFYVPNKMQLTKKYNNGTKEKSTSYILISKQNDTTHAGAFQYDGFTKLLAAESDLIIGQNYRIKMAIADVHDRKLDSGVILNAKSFKMYSKLEKPKLESTITKKHIVLHDTILFSLNKYFLSSISKAKLNRVVYQFNNTQNKKVYIVGHADPRGDKTLNIQLAANRALEVKKYLIENGIPKSAIVIDSYGGSKPINKKQVSAAINRRVEVLLM